MADIRTLKLNLLADTNDFHRGLRGASGATKTFAGQVGHYTRRAAQAFALVGAAAGAMAVKIGVDSVKAAIEDEASQTRLAKTLRNTVKATDAQVASTERLIRAEQLQKGFSDDQLRAAYGRIIASTKDATKARQILTLAEDTARGTGRDLESVSMAISKAYDGNLGALKRLGVPLDANIVKTKDTKAALEELSKLYGGQASTYADTFAGKIARLSETWQQLKEGIGGAIIDRLGSILDYFQRIGSVLTGTADQGLSNKVKSLRLQMDGPPGTDNLAKALMSVSNSFQNLFTTLSGGSPDANTQLNNLASALQRIANGINAIANGYGKLDRFVKSENYQRFLDLIFGPKGSAASRTIIPFGSVDVSKRASGGPVTGGMPYLVGERGPELFLPSSNGSIVPNNALGGTTVININGIVDAESARRSIQRLIQESSRRTGPVSWTAAVS